MMEVARALNITNRKADRLTRTFAQMEGVNISDAVTRRFRDGRRRLNLADCMHYAFAMHFDVPNLTTADEFRQTDLRVVP